MLNLETVRSNYINGLEIHDIKDDNVIYEKREAYSEPLIFAKSLFYTNHQPILNYLTKMKSLNPEFKIIDIGGSANNWAAGVSDAIVDINMPLETDRKYFAMNVNYESEYTELLEYVSDVGKFDFAICSHILEDISTPAVLIKMLSKIAHGGYISFPSKYCELQLREGNYVGSIHHRWIYSFEDGALKAYPKQNFLDTQNFVRKIGSLPGKGHEFQDLRFMWQGEIPFSIVNNDYLGPTAEAVVDYYKKLLHDDCDIMKTPKVIGASIVSYIFNVEVLPHLTINDDLISVSIPLYRNEYTFLEHLEMIDSFGFEFYKIIELYYSNDKLCQIDAILSKKIKKD